MREENAKLSTSAAMGRWSLATIAGFGLSVGLAGIIEAQMMAGCEHDCGITVGIPFVILVIPFTLLLGGTLAGIMQRSLVLKRLRRGGSGWWVPLSAVGFLGFWLPLWLQDIYELRAIYPLTVLILPGTAVGLLQWSFLRKILPRAGWWIPGSVLAYGPISFWWDDYFSPASWLGPFLIFGVGLWTAVISGAVMGGLVREGGSLRPRRSRGS